jgi:prepilin-type N-terminal cleavage/methylation domain-containing protein
MGLTMRDASSIPSCPAGPTPGTGTLRAFTLIELLTVIAIVAVLASLLLTALNSAKKKSQTVVCTSNLHQPSLAVNLYLDESGTRPTMEALKAGRYLPPGKVQLCPADKTENWGALLQSPPKILFPGNPTNSTYKAGFSYLVHPLGWDLSLWNHLLRYGSGVGIAACQLHGLGKQDSSDVHNFSGILLRAQRDGAVVRRQLFWDPALMNLPIPVIPSGGTNEPYLYPLPVYIDNPVEWLQGIH